MGARAALRQLGPAALVALPPLAVLGAVGRVHVDVPGEMHLFGVGASAALAAIAATALSVVGARRGDARTVLLGTGFSVMAGLLAVHGLTTPGFLVGQNGVVAFSGAATLPVGAALLALAVLPALRRPRAIRPLLVLEGVLLAGVLALGGIGVLVPRLVPPVPEPNGPVARATLAAGLVLFVLLGARALRTYRLTRRGADLAVVAGVAWLAAALPGALVLDYHQLGWWLGHGFELVGVTLVGVPLALDLRRAYQSRPLSGGLPAEELVQAEEEFLGGRVRALMRILGERDPSTEGHTRRVALRTVQVGDELGLPPERLRTLAAGALLHDVGKLTVADPVLKKPGPLDDEEYALVQRHARAGEGLLDELGGFAPGVRRLVLRHHERLDGSGYPDGLRGAELDLETRILAVCDVYDALVSPRVYRAAWPHERAVELLREEAGRRLDARCVAALERVLARERAELPVAV